MLLQHGLIAGGLADGSVAIWDAHQILKGRPESALLAKEAKHHGAVSKPLLSINPVISLAAHLGSLSYPLTRSSSGGYLVDDTHGDAGERSGLQSAEPKSASIRWC